MNKREQKALIRAMTQSCAKAMIEKIDKGLVPKEWDGHELRVWFAEDVARQYAAMSLIKQYPRSRRAREFHNTMATSVL